MGTPKETAGQSVPEDNPNATRTTRTSDVLAIIINCDINIFDILCRLSAPWAVINTATPPAPLPLLYLESSSSHRRCSLGAASPDNKTNLLRDSYPPTGREFTPPLNGE